MPPTPATLREWRQLELPVPAWQAWQQFEPFFEQHGYKLFVPDLDYTQLLRAPEDCGIRGEDANSLFLPECLGMAVNPSAFCMQTGIHVAARAPSNLDVVIRIMAIGDEGREHLAIMRELAAPEARVPENRTVPMIAELTTGGVVFGIFPVMWTHAMQIPWFETGRQLLDALDQVLEGFAFLHKCLIAHRDFDLSEVFSNYGRGWDPMKRRPKCKSIPPIFRSCCPDFRYLINDFDLSIKFAPESDPETRLVTGVPIARYGGTAEVYGKLLAPEARLDAPYCPFKADIYQLGASALEYCQNVHTLPELLALLAAMADDDPAARPTAADTLSTLRNICETASDDALDDIPVDPLSEYRRILPGETCTCSGCRLPPQNS